MSTVDSIQTVVTDVLKDLTEEDFSSDPRGGRTTSSNVLLLKGTMSICSNDFFLNKVSFITFVTDLIYLGSWSLYPYKNRVNEFQSIYEITT
jgi:hypothetical protein